MGAVVALDALFNGGRVWKGRPAAPPASVHPTGLAALDAVFPFHAAAGERYGVEGMAHLNA